MLDIPETGDDIAVGWLESAFARGGTSLTRRLPRIEREPIAAGTGVLGELTRLHLTFGDGEGPAPASVIVKLPSQTFTAAVDLWTPIPV